MNLFKIPAFAGDDELLNVIIETPKGSRNKFDYDDERGLFKLGGALPAGMEFPYHFGFVPSTLGGDGDPLDVLLLMDGPTYPGCLVEARLLGVIEAEQTEEGGTTRNDRLIAVPNNSRLHRHVRQLEDINENLVAEIEQFFVSYNAVRGKQFKPLGRGGVERARDIVNEAEKRLAQESPESGSG